MIHALFSTVVTPAQAGVQSHKGQHLATLDSGLRRNDEGVILRHVRHCEPFGCLAGAQDKLREAIQSRASWIAASPAAPRNDEGVISLEGSVG